jgi:hypothetical protein
MPLDLLEAMQGIGEYLYRDVKVTMKAYTNTIIELSFVGITVSYTHRMFIEE